MSVGPFRAPQLRAHARKAGVVLLCAAIALSLCATLIENDDAVAIAGAVGK